MTEGTDEKGARLVLVGLVLLITYNLVFFAGKFIVAGPLGFLRNIYLDLYQNKGMLTFLEFLGVASVFVDLLGRYEQFGKFRVIRILVIGLLIAAFIFKIFMNYLDSAYM